MKRAIGLFLIILLFMAGNLSVWGGMPFAPVFDAGQPGLQPGSLLFIRPVGATGVRTGDIVIYNVPRFTRETGNLPPVIARSVIEVRTDRPVTWLLIYGDPGEDPFPVRLLEIRGTLEGQIPYLGVPLLVFRSSLGMVVIAVFIVLLALFLYSNDIVKYLGSRFGSFVSPIIEENQRVDLVLSNRFEATEKALANFAQSMELYAGHLASHTSAIRGLSEASQSLKGSAEEQNRILSQWTRNLTPRRSGDELSRIQEVVNDFERRTREALQAKNVLESQVPGEKPQMGEAPPLMEKIKSPPGCAVKPRAFLLKPHHYSTKH